MTFSELTVGQLEATLMWATILGMSILTASAFIWAGLRTRIHGLRQRMYGVEPKVADVTAYAYLGVMKLIVLMCFLIPWLAIVIAF
jgi:hypothetical protein